MSRTEDMHTQTIADTGSAPTRRPLGIAPILVVTATLWGIDLNAKRPASRRQQSQKQCRAPRRTLAISW